MDNLSQAETAKRMGKNQVSVSRSERKILEKLRRKML
jgi:DNA-directed RNA polymerase specialized sigma subunit